MIRARFLGVVVRDAVARRRVDFRTGKRRSLAEDGLDGFAADEPGFAIRAHVRGRLVQIEIGHHLLGGRPVEDHAAFTLGQVAGCRVIVRAVVNAAVVRVRAGVLRHVGDLGHLTRHRERERLRHLHPHGFDVYPVASNLRFAPYHPLDVVVIVAVEVELTVEIITGEWP